jgi:hypothetical protein
MGEKHPPEASPPKSIISKVGGFVGECLGLLGHLAEAAVAFAISAVMICLHLITLAIPLAIAIFIALWAYKTFLAD